MFLMPFFAVGWLSIGDDENIPSTAQLSIILMLLKTLVQRFGLYTSQRRADQSTVDGRTDLVLAGLGSTAGRSVQRQFDDAVACLRAVLSELRCATSMVDAVRLAIDPGVGTTDGSAARGRDADAVLADVHRIVYPCCQGQGNRADNSFKEGMRACSLCRPVSILPASDVLGCGAESEWGNGVCSGEAVGECVAGRACGAGSEALVGAMEQQLAEWEEVVRSHQLPSRVARWAGASGIQR
jgi:hypothetical protein